MFYPVGKGLELQLEPGMHADLSISATPRDADRWRGTQ